MKIRSTIPAVVAAALFLPACGGDSGPTAIEIPLARVEITGPCPTVDEGATCQMTARGITADNQIVTNAVLRWSSNANSIAQVNNDGRVFGLAPGTATITVEASFGTGRATSRVTVFPCQKNCP
ncbi:MAG TPA: Ig-like domain-containing protein [Gemmatimonadota bacterium]|nr:Ig-like domain-containing protein [Gemmatimonadota bacterium]